MISGDDDSGPWHVFRLIPLDLNSCVTLRIKLDCPCLDCGTRCRYLIPCFCPPVTGTPDAPTENGEPTGKSHRLVDGSFWHAQTRRVQALSPGRDREAPAGPRYARWSSTLTCLFQSRYMRSGLDLQFRTFPLSAWMVCCPYRKYTSAGISKHAKVIKMRVSRHERSSAA